MKTKRKCDKCQKFAAICTALRGKKKAKKRQLICNKKYRHIKEKEC